MLSTKHRFKSLLPSRANLQKKDTFKGQRYSEMRNNTTYNGTCRTLVNTALTQSACSEYPVSYMSWNVRYLKYGPIEKSVEIKVFSIW